MESGLLKSVKVGKRLSLSGGKLKSGYPMTETRPALLSASLPRAAWLTEKADKEAGHRPGGARFPGP